MPAPTPTPPHAPPPRLAPQFSVLSQVQGMFEPTTRGWRERICCAVDAVMERDEPALAIA
jgi:hypothetical protein